MGFRYNGALYMYAKNIQGDIIGIVNEAGSMVVEYTYDAWGNPLSTTGTAASTIGAANPLRYRGYYYDEETGLYYLQSRYYNPVWGRFINADSYAQTTVDSIGANMFAYCGNNPVMLSDPTGHSATAALAWSFLWGMLSTYVISPMFPDISKDVSNALDNLWEDIRDFAWADAKTRTINNDTIIYRNGGKNPGNLTPREKDIEGIAHPNRVGVSFSLTPKRGSVQTTIGKVVSTGILYVVWDGGNHISVRPKGASVEDWYKAGRNSAWTIALQSVVTKWG